MVIVLFRLDDTDRECHFLEETFLLANNNMNIVFGMFFLSLNNVKLDPIQQPRASIEIVYYC